MNFKNPPDANTLLSVTDHCMRSRGYKEEGTTTTPFDMAVLNEIDRFHLAGDVIERVPGFETRSAYIKQFLRDKLLDHKSYIKKHGEDMPEIRNWKWSQGNNVNNS